MLCLCRWIWSSMLTCRELQVEVFWCPGQKATICFGAYSVAIFMAVGSWAGGLWSCAHQPCQLRPNVRCISTLPGHSHHGISANFICARSLVQIENHAALLLELVSILRIRWQISYSFCCDLSWLKCIQSRFGTQSFLFCASLKLYPCGSKALVLCTYLSSLKRSCGRTMHWSY